MEPLSLSPGDAQPGARTPATTATTRPISLAAVPPAPQAGAEAPMASGSYVVQVSSQRSEADAKASFRALQSRYPNVLGGRQSMVRRADLGSKGVYYRTLVGPFASSDQAAAFCSSLKAAGGQCLIHRN
jgi:cell division septation protein DedD